MVSRFFVGKPAIVNSLKFGKYDIYGFGNHESAGIEKKHYMEDGTFGYSEGVDALQEKQVVRTEI